MVHCDKCKVVLSENQRKEIECHCKLEELRDKHIRILCNICDKIENGK